MPKLFILTDILENDPESGYFVVESITYALNGIISRYTDVNNIGDYKRLNEIIQHIADRHGYKVDELEIINLSNQVEIAIADLQ